VFQDWWTTGQQLQVTLSGVPSFVVPKQSFVQNVSYAYIGNQALPGVLLSIFLPAFTRFDAAHSSPGWVFRGNNLFTLNLGTLNPGSRGAVRFAVTVLPVIP